MGVKNKEDYQKLCDVKVWPTELLGQKISVTMLKFTPDQFTLVVRFVLHEFSVEHVAKEVRKSATTVDNFREIVYPYPRGTNDFRLNVSDMKEYNGLLGLGHIGVGNKLCTITPYRPANKLTFCNKCWSVGHIRSKCSYSIQKCRFCLEDFSDGHNEICTKQYKCAQCNHKHYSLDANCEVIQEYRANLNKAVKQATMDGIIKPTQTKAQRTTAPQHFKPNMDMFPPLPGATTQQSYKPAPWKIVTAPAQMQLSNQNKSTDITNQQLLDKFCLHLDDKLSKIKDQITSLEHKSNQNDRMGVELRQHLTNLLGLVKRLVTDIVPPIVKSTFTKDTKTKKSVEKSTSEINDQIEAICMDIGLNNTTAETKNKEGDQLQVENLNNSRT
ncbi:hypothetical protein I4U23_011495 [Adineta vaga]|nr:hypothetical protein I4U23_011495 [Adineta vaga]